MRFLPFAYLLIFGSATLYGQTFQDALRYSFVEPRGTARFVATGGSLTPLGVDPTTLHTNPAGIGWNRSNLVEITPGLTFTGTDVTLFEDPNGEAVNEGNVNFNLPSIGLVLAGETRSLNWPTLNFGVSFTRMADYNQQIRFEGRSAGSIIEGFAELASAGEFDPYGSELAIPFLIEDQPGVFFSDFFDFDANQSRGDLIARDGLYDRSGGMNELAIGFGGNYRNKALWGLSVGIPFFDYEQTLRYEEVDDEDVIPAFESTEYNEFISTSGAGFNLRLGVILLPTEKLRVSAAVHTPTFWSIDETFNTSLGYFYSEDGQALGGTELSPELITTYNLSTPWRFTGGLGVLIGRQGFVSIDADYTNYQGNSFSFDDFATAAEATNADIDALLDGSIGLRAGGELNLDALQVRAGIGYRQLPFTEFFLDEDEAIITYNAGLGYSLNKLFFDLSLGYQTYSTFQDVYQTLDVTGQTLLTDRNRVFVSFTVGYRGFAFN